MGSSLLPVPFDCFYGFTTKLIGISWYDSVGALLSDSFILGLVIRSRLYNQDKIVVAMGFSNEAQCVLCDLPVEDVFFSCRFANRLWCPVLDMCVAPRCLGNW